MHNNQRSQERSDADLVIERGNTKWTAGASLSWDVDVPEKDDYEVYLIASVDDAGDGKKLLMETAGGQSELTLSKTSGPFPGGENFAVSEVLNFQRVKLPVIVSLEAGKQVITVSTPAVETEEILLHFRTFELLPVSKKKIIAQDEARAKSARASVDWMVDSGYGLMFHWTSKAPMPDGTIKTFEDAVNDFDVEKFADMVEETGAGYVYFPIGHAESFCPAPIESWEKLFPGQTTERDLIMELADAFNERGIRLLCYVNGPLGFGYPRYGGATDEIRQQFVENFKVILEELGTRYGKKIEGYWFDTMIAIFKDFQHIPFEELFNASKIGNKDRVICLNAWIWPDVSPWQDYWPGEVQHPIAPPVNGYMENGPSPDLPYQVLLTMEKHAWGASKSGIKDPKFTSEQLSSYILACKDNGGFVTINLSVFQDGAIGEKALEVMRGVKSEIRK